MDPEQSSDGTIPLKRVCRVSLERCDKLLQNPSTSTTQTENANSESTSVAPTEAATPAVAPTEAATSAAAPTEAATSAASPAEKRKRKKHDAHEHDGHSWHLNKEKNGTSYYDCAK